MSALLIIPPLIILFAFYGPADVTSIVRGAVHNNKLIIGANDKIFGDTYVGWKKTLVVFYKYGNSHVYNEIVTNGTTLNITYFPSSPIAPPNYRAGITILGSVYGIKDVTTDAQVYVDAGDTNISASNGKFGDPWSMVRKSFMVVYRLPTGEIKGKVVEEDAEILLN